MSEILLNSSKYVPKGENVIRWRIFRKLFGFLREDVVVDVGSGSGHWAKKIVPLVKLVVLVDVDKNQIRKAHREKSRYNEFYIVADANFLPFKNQSFSKMLSNQVMEHIPNPTSAFLEASRVLKRKGIFVVSTPNSSFLAKYDFALLKTLEKIIPRMIIRDAHHFIIGDFLKMGYNGWMRNVGHVRKGFNLSDLENLGSSSGLVSVEHRYIHKRLVLIFWELTFSVPFVEFLLRPLECILYSLDDKFDCEGLDIAFKYQKLDSRTKRSDKIKR